MWTEVEFKNATSMRGIEIFHHLKADGLVQGEDFVWSFIPGKWITEWKSDPYGYGQKYQEKSVIVKFREPSMATFYALKWQHR